MRSGTEFLHVCLLRGNTVDSSKSCEPDISLGEVEGSRRGLTFVHEKTCLFFSLSPFSICPAGWRAVGWLSSLPGSHIVLQNPVYCDPQTVPRLRSEEPEVKPSKSKTVVQPSPKSTWNVSLNSVRPVCSPFASSLAPNLQRPAPLFIFTFII